MKKPTIIIKNAKKKDILCIVKLQKGLAKYHEKTASTKDDKFYEGKNKNASLLFRKFLQEHINNKKSLVLIAHDNKKPIAYCLSFIKEDVPIFKVREYGYISDLYVEEEYRRQGLGKKFINLSKKFFKNKKIKFIQLAVRSHNQKAINLYRKAGFKDHHITMRMRI